VRFKRPSRRNRRELDINSTHLSSSRLKSYVLLHALLSRIFNRGCFRFEMEPSKRESVPPPEFQGVHAGGGTINRSRKYSRRAPRVGDAPRIIAGTRQCPRRIWIPGECSRKLWGRGRVPRDIVTLREPRGVLTVFVVIVVTCSKGTRDTRNKFPSPSSLASSPMQSRAGEEEGGGWPITQAR